MASRFAVLLAACLAVSTSAVRPETMPAENEPDDKVHPLSLAEKSNHTKKKGLFTWCSGWCVECPETGIEWKVNRAQSTMAKLAKGAMVLAGAALMVMSGGMAGAVGALFMGAAATVGVGSSLAIGAGALGAAHMLTSNEERACPQVDFDQKLPENKGLISSTKHNFLALFGAEKHKETKYTLMDVNYFELLLRVKQANGQEVLQGDRSSMDEKDRLNDCLACNYLTFEDKLWCEKKEQETGKVISESEQDEIKAGVIESCGKWLCAGNAQNARKLGILSKCGGRTSIIKALWR